MGALATSCTPYVAVMGVKVIIAQVSHKQMNGALWRLNRKVQMLRRLNSASAAAILLTFNTHVERSAANKRFNAVEATELGV